MTASSIVAALARYARGFHQVAGDGHHVASPLGAWLLLALAGPVCAGDDLRQLTQILGVDADAAAGLAAELLSHPHPVVHAGSAMWGGSGSAAGTRIASWLAGLPPRWTPGPCPPRRAWTPGPGGTRRPDRPVPGRGRCDSHLAARDRAGDPGVLAAAVRPGSCLRARSGQPVGRDTDPRTAHPGRTGERRGSRARPVHRRDRCHWRRGGARRQRPGRAGGGLGRGRSRVPAADVLSAAYDLGTALAAGRPLARRSLFDLPLGDGAAWTITQERARYHRTGREGGAVHRGAARLVGAQRPPAHRPAAGVRRSPARAGPLDPWQARQAAMARYTRTGFEAAAVTALAVALSAVTRKPGIRRTAELRFGHPFAVVAVTTGAPAPGPPPFRSRPAHGTGCRCSQPGSPTPTMPPPSLTAPADGTRQPVSDRVHLVR